jgi:competence protein ComEA
MARAFGLLALLVVVALAIWHPAPRPPLAVASPAASPAPERHARRHATPAAGATIVYVVGAVRRPGLYRLDPAARTDDAVRAAGGLRADADPAGVNLASHPSDGDEIVVPVRGELPSTAILTKRKRGSPARARKKASAAIVSLNAADAAQLASVPGIGATIAARIVAVREHDGAYATFDELLDVAGMTESRLERAQPYLRI